MQLLIKGGNSPQGVVNIKAAKNSVLPILAGCTMSSHEIVLRNISPFGDILEMLALLRSLGCVAYIQGDSIVANCKGLDKFSVDATHASKLRASICLLGPLSTRSSTVDISLPGGCNIGSRPVDVHLSGMRQLGFDVQQADSVVVKAKKLAATTIKLPIQSVGATQNLIMAACGVPGTTILKNVAQEPEVEDLANFINAIGGRVTGAGSSTVEVQGKQVFHGCEYTPIGDRIVAGTYLMSGALGLGGSVTVQGVSPMSMQHTIKILQQMGCDVVLGSSTATIKSFGRLKTFGPVKTRPYPGFATDMQAQLVVVQCLAKGKCTVCENMFENRFGHVPQLNEMGADIKVEGNVLHIVGVPKLYARTLQATDLRCGAALVLAGLATHGQTTVSGVNYIDRGYYQIEHDLQQLGLDVIRQTKEKI